MHKKDTDGSLTEVTQLTCTHMEADPRLALHAVFASQQQTNEAVAVVSDDTDVLIILLSIVSKMHGDLFFRQGKSTIGKGIEYHNVSSLASYLGEDCCQILPAFHALTGSDFTYPFFRRSKYQSFSLMMNMKKSRNRVSSYHLLNMLGTNEVNSEDVIEFLLRTISTDQRRKLLLKSPVGP